MQVVFLGDHGNQLVTQDKGCLLYTSAFSGFLVKDALFFQHLLGGQLLTGGIQTLMRLLSFSDVYKRQGRR